MADDNKDEGEAGWKKLGGATVFIGGDGTIEAGCEGLEGHHVDELDETREERDAKQDAAEAAGWQSQEEKDAQALHAQASQHAGDGAIVLVRIGDKFRTFGPHAQVAQQLLQMGDGKVADFDHEHLERHLKTLVGQGHRVAIVERSEQGQPRKVDDVWPGDFDQLQPGEHGDEADPGRAPTPEQSPATPQAAPQALASPTKPARPFDQPLGKMLTATQSDAAHRATYVDPATGKKIASSRDTPSQWDASTPVGTWRVDDSWAGNYGHTIEQLQEVDPHSVVLSEDDYYGTTANPEGRGWDSDRYADWIREGKEPPPITLLQMEDGRLKASDGHRRLAAAKKAGAKSIKAWVSPAANTGKLDYNGKPIQTAATYQLAIRDAIANGEEVPPHALEELAKWQQKSPENFPAPQAQQQSPAPTPAEAQAAPPVPTPETRWHVTPAAEAIRQGGFAAGKGGGIGGAVAGEGVSVWKDEKSADKMLKDVQAMEAIRTAADPIAAAVQATGRPLSDTDAIAKGYAKGYFGPAIELTPAQRAIVHYQANENPYIPARGFFGAEPPRTWEKIAATVKAGAKNRIVSDSEDLYNPDDITPSPESQAAPPVPTQPTANPAIRVSADGTQWIRAPKGGGTSDVNGRDYKGGQWMPIHGLSQKPTTPPPQPVQPPAPSTPAKPNEDGKGRAPRAPMTPEQIEAERQRRQQSEQWREVVDGPLGKMFGLESPHPHALRRHDPGTRNVAEWANQPGVGEAGLKKLAEWAAPVGFEQSWNNLPDYEKAKLTKEEARQLYDEHMSAMRSDTGYTKKQLKATPSIDAARLAIGETLSGNRGFYDSAHLHNLHKAMAAIQAGQEPPPVEGIHAPAAAPQEPQATPEATPAAPQGPQPGQLVPMPQVGDRPPQNLKVFDVDADGNVSLGLEHHGRGHVKVPPGAYQHFVNDLVGKVDIPPNSGNPLIDAVGQGKAEFLGKGDDGLAFGVGDKVVKASTIVPFIPENYRGMMPPEAADRLERQGAVQNELAAIHPGILPVEVHRHGDKSFLTMERVTPLDKQATPEQLNQVRDIMRAMHAAGYALNDDPQFGLDAAGNVRMFDTGKAAKTRDSWSFDDDQGRLDRAYGIAGQELAPWGEKARAGFDTWEGFFAGKVSPEKLPKLKEHFDNAVQSVKHMEADGQDVSEAKQIVSADAAQMGLPDPFAPAQTAAPDTAPTEQFPDPGRPPHPAFAKAQQQLANVPPQMRHAFEAMHKLGDVSSTGTGSTDRLDPGYAKALYDHMAKMPGFSDGFGQVYDLSSELGPGALGYYSPAGVMALVPSQWQGGNWEARYSAEVEDVEPADQEPQSAVQPGPEPDLFDTIPETDYGDGDSYEQPPEIKAAEDAKSKAYLEHLAKPAGRDRKGKKLDGGGHPDLAKVAMETFPDDPQSAHAAAEIALETWKPVKEMYDLMAESRSALLGLGDGKSGPNPAALKMWQAVQRGADPASIPYFDEKLSDAAASHPHMLQPYRKDPRTGFLTPVRGSGENGALTDSDKESAFMENLGRSAADYTPPGPDHPAFFGAAVEYLARSAGQTAETVPEDQDAVPFAKRAQYYRKAATRYAKRYAKPWNEHEHKRDHGKFAAVAQAADEADDQLEGAAAQAVTEFIAHPPRSKQRERPLVPIMFPAKLEAIAAGEDPAGSAELETAFAPVREKLRTILGDAPTLYRVENKRPGSVRHALSWTLNPKFAQDYAGHYGLEEITDEQVKAAIDEYHEKGATTLGGKPYRRYKDGEFAYGREGSENYEGEDYLVETMQDQQQAHNEFKVDNDQKWAAVRQEEIPLDDVLWVSNRAGQMEFIVRNKQG